MAIVVPWWTYHAAFYTTMTSSKMSSNETNQCTILYTIVNLPCSLVVLGWHDEARAAGMTKSSRE